MKDYELPRLIRQIVREEITPLLMGKVESTESPLRATARRFPSEGAIPNQRILSPYGLASRPKKGTSALVAPVAGDATHLNLLSCFDESRPDHDEGEAVLYGADGQVVYMKNGGTIHQGSKEADEPVVLGNVAKSFLRDWISVFIETDPLGYDSFGLPVELAPEIKEFFLAFRDLYLDDPDTNILGQKNFVERGD